MKRKEIKSIEKEIKRESKDIFKYYPRYKRDLVINNKISCLYIENYFKNNISEFGDYDCIFDECATIELACEILESLSPKLKERFISEYQKGNIIISDNVRYDCTSTFVDNEKVICEIKKNGTIVDPISCIHEFFHFLHLERCKKEITREDYYYYTEILGLAGELYSIFYLAFIRKEYIEDIKNYFTNLLNSLMDCAQEVLIVGTLLGAYNKYHFLSKRCISKYLKKADTLDEEANILEIFYSFEDINYFEYVRYVNALPVALQISFDLLSKNKEKYSDIFEKLGTMMPENILSNLDLDNHLKDEQILKELISILFINFNDVLKIDSNEDSKKYGQKN